VTTPKLSTIPSTGPRLDEFFVDGRMYVNQRSTPCPFCETAIAAGEPISFVRGDWAHAACATDSLVSGGAANAWLTLGSDLARHPRAYKTAETRLIVNQLLRIAAGINTDDVNFEDVA
jgi:hypothetical protein